MQLTCWKINRATIFWKPICMNGNPFPTLFSIPSKTEVIIWTVNDLLSATFHFSLSHNVVVMLLRRIQYNHHLSLDYSIGINPLSKLKAFADNKLNVPRKIKFAFNKVENEVGKGDNAGYQHFLLFPQALQKSLSKGRKNQGLFGKGLRVNVHIDSPKKKQQLPWIDHYYQQ